ncbi:MAG: phosphoribosylanthranilate isomerase, partial [SAR202 cluster bacterium]|nr:phosphoribosylanthranilate isomerase [SAR202 cluster bacterium]
RYVEPTTAAAILARLPPFVTTVGLVVDQEVEPILRICPVDVVQFHGQESPDMVRRCARRAIKAFRVRSSSDLDRLAPYVGTAAFLLDAYVPGQAGGTGQQFPWDLARPAREAGTPIIVAGGLTPENVAECIKTTAPYGVDVSTGVEAAPGVKDPQRVQAFVAAVRRAAYG